MDLVKIKQILFDEMFDKIAWSGEKSGKYYHGERVAKLALTLKKYILPDDDGSHDDIITVAGWFHDISNGEENHALVGAEKTKVLLGEYCTEYEMREIYDIMYRHDDRFSDRAEFSVYAKLQQDADHFDHFGTYNIWMGFVRRATRGGTIIEAIEGLKECQKEFEVYREQFNFGISTKIFDDRIEFFNDFVDRFSIEGIGGIWNEEKLCGE